MSAVYLSTTGRKVTMRSIGAHVSAAGGLHTVFERAAGIGCTAVQLFSGSPRVWYKKPIAEIVTDKFFSEREKYSISPVITHALYLVNLASDNTETLRKSFESLQYELRFDAAIHGSGVVVHVGSHQGRGWDATRAQIVTAIADILKVTPQESCFLIENAAGQNGKIGGNLQEVAWLLAQLEADNQWVSKGRVGWCFDTCHAHAAGYYLGTHAPQAQLFAAEKIGREPASAVQEMTRLDLWEALKCIHVNDSRDPFGSGRDRHENIGDGLIGLEHLKAFLATQELQAKPLILEVPGSGEGPDAQNVRRLSELVAA